VGGGGGDVADLPAPHRPHPDQPPVHPHPPAGAGG
jgi:hypothetical protein